MAEFVRLHTEAAIVEYDLLNKSGLCDDKEISDTKQKRADFENKVNGPHKNQEDFKGYIQLEWTLYDTLTTRILKSGKELHTYYSLLIRIARRIKTLYEVAITYFPNNVSFHLGFIEFLQAANIKHQDESVCKTMIRLHPTNEDVWLTAARWYRKNGKTNKFLIEYLLEGLKTAKTTEKIYKEIIQLECQENTKNVDIHIEDMIKRNVSSEHVFSILEYLEKQQHTEKAQEILLKYLDEKYSDKAETYNYIAQNILKSKTIEEDAKFSNIFEKFEDGFKTVIDDERRKLWHMYITFLIDVKEDMIGGKYDKEILLKQAFQNASKEYALPIPHYKIWCELDSQEALNILEKATNNHRESAELWSLRVKLTIRLKDRRTVLNLFDEVSNVLFDPLLWDDMYYYHTLNSSKEEIDEFLKRGISCKQQYISLKFKYKYLNWLNLCGKIEECRELFQTLISTDQLTKDLYLIMLKIEESAFRVDFDELVRLHELAINTFGKTELDVWMNYARTYKNHYSREVAPEKLKELYNRARDTLLSFYIEDLTERFKKYNYL